MFLAATARSATNLFSTQFEAVEGYNGAWTLVGQQGWLGEGTGGNKFAGGQFGFKRGPVDVSVSYGESNNSTDTNKLKKGSIGAKYDFGPVVVLGYVTQNKYLAQKLNVYQLGARVPVGAHTFRANFTKADASGLNQANVSTEADDANQLAVGWIYDMSKRTALYASAARIDNKGNARYLVQSTPASPVGRKSTGVEFGMRHTF